MSAQPESFRPESRIDALRVPPQSVEAEQAVIGGLMLAPESLAIVADILTEEDFYRRDHRLLYRAIRELDDKKKPFDAVTLGEWLESNKLDDQIGGTGYLIDLASTTPSAANIRAYADIVAGKALLRRLIEAGTEIVTTGFQPNGEDPEQLVAQAQHRLGMVAPMRGTGGLELPRDSLKSWFNDLRERWESDEWMTGLSTPYVGMDEITFGLQPADLIVVAARPGMGKSVLAGGVAMHVAEMHGPTAIFSLEMGRKQMLQRMVAARGQIPHEWLRSPKAYERKHPNLDTDELWSKVNMAVRHLVQLPLLIDESAGLTIDQVIARARRAHQKRPLKLVILDHIHIVALAGRDVVNELAAVSKKLKALAKELQAPVVALAQLNRSNKDRTDKRPNMADLRASGAIEQDADEIWFLHREDYYHKHTHLKDVVELINGKSRNAPMGATAHLRNAFHQMRLEDWVGALPEPEQPNTSPPAGRWKKRGQEAAAGGD